MKTALHIRGLEKSFKQTRVLKSVDFEVRQGEVFALLGSNGAGKTTVIRILATLLRPDAGTICVGGFDVVKQPDRVREVISLAGQFAAVDEILTGHENLHMIGKLRHLSDVQSKADELLRQFDLMDAANRSVATYSGGMRRRLDLAMSLMGDPSILFLDEPTTGLDPQGRLAVWKHIKDLASRGTTVFLTTQYLEEAEQLADHAAILHEGTIVVEGTITALKNLLPSGSLSLSFYDERTAQEAFSILKEYETEFDAETIAVIVETDGSAKQIADILNRLEAAHITVATFAQKLPTLEDVFLNLTEIKKEEMR